MSDAISLQIESVQPKKRRKITIDDVESICSLLAKRITERGACLLLGIKEDSWRNWKSKKLNESRFKDIFERVRETKINAIIETIDEAGEKRTFVNKRGEEVTTSGDWRAKAWIAERVLAPERFADRRNENTSLAQPVVQVNVITEGLKRVYGSVSCGDENKFIEDKSVQNTTIDSKCQ